jgi:capsular exopolysaccharide synthesis family protein
LERSPQRSSWLADRPARAELLRYLQLVRSHTLMLIVFIAAGLAGAFVYTSVEHKTYTAEADLLVTPVSTDNPSLVGLPLVRDTSDPTAAVLTVSKLVSSPTVAALVAGQLGGKPAALLSSVTATPVTSSSIIAVQATASSPGRAAQLANAFAQQTVQSRTDAMHAQLATLIPSLEASMKSLPSDERSSLASQLATYETLKVSPDPTLRVSSPATPPSSPASPSRKLALIGGGFGGLVLGLLAILGLQALDPKLRDEEQLRELYNLPILARIPRQRAGATPLAPDELTTVAADAFRTLRSGFTVKQSDDGPGHAILVTGDAAGDGKTTVALNLAAALVAAGNQVMLIESDMRRPSIGRALKLRAPHGAADVLLGQTELAQALVWMRRYGPQLEFLLAGGAEASEVDRIPPPSVRHLISEARAISDFVVIDSPPLTDVADALPFAREADEVLLVARVGNSQVRKMNDLGELLTRQGVVPTGVVLVGASDPRGGYYYRYNGGQPALFGLLQRRDREPRDQENGLSAIAVTEKNGGGHL